MAKWGIDDTKSPFDLSNMFSDVVNQRENLFNKIERDLKIRGINPRMAMIERDVKLVKIPLGFELHETFEVKAHEDRKND